MFYTIGPSRKFHFNIELYCSSGWNIYRSISSTRSHYSGNKLSISTWIIYTSSNTSRFYSISIHNFSPKLYRNIQCILKLDTNIFFLSCLQRKSLITISFTERKSFVRHIIGFQYSTCIDKHFCGRDRSYLLLRCCR